NVEQSRVGLEERRRIEAVKRSRRCLAERYAREVRERGLERNTSLARGNVDLSQAGNNSVIHLRAGHGRSKQRERRIEFGNQNGTTDDIANRVRRGPIEPDAAGSLVDSYLGSRAISERRAMTDRYLIGPVDPGDPFECVADEPNFGSQLHLVAHMLELASATISEVAARWVPAIRRRFNHILNCSARVIFLALGDSHLKTLTWHG